VWDCGVIYAIYAACETDKPTTRRREHRRTRAFSVWLQTERHLLGVGRRLIDAFPTYVTDG